MKNIKKYIVTLSFVLFGSYSVIYAHGGDMSSNGTKSNNINMQQGQMHNSMNQQVMKKIELYKMILGEVGILKEKMRQRYFEDLRNVLVEYPAILIKYISGRVMNGW